jgi:hypothetical protein
MTSRLVPSPRAMPAPYSAALFCLNSHPSTDSLRGRYCRQPIQVSRGVSEAGRQAGRPVLGGCGLMRCGRAGWRAQRAHSLAGREGKEAAADGRTVVLHG